MKYSSWEVAAAILVQRGEPVHYADLATSVIRSGLSGLGKEGRTPAQSLNVIMKSRSTIFNPMGRGWFEIRDPDNVISSNPTIGDAHREITATASLQAELTEQRQAAAASRHTSRCICKLSQAKSRKECVQDGVAHLLADILGITAANFSTELQLDESSVPTVWDVVKTLSPDESRAINLLYGLEENGVTYIGDVAARLSLSEEQVYSLISSALRKMRHPTRLRKMETYFRNEEEQIIEPSRPA